MFMEFEQGDWKGVIRVIKEITSKPCRTATKPEFEINLMNEVTEKNSMILQQYGYNMAWSIAKNK
eukprot:2371447-Ditylum_brightwellii.AAC.1